MTNRFLDSTSPMLPSSLVMVMTFTFISFSFLTILTPTLFSFQLLPAVICDLNLICDWVQLRAVQSVLITDKDTVSSGVIDTGIRNTGYTGNADTQMMQPERRHTQWQGQKMIQCILLLNWQNHLHDELIFSYLLYLTFLFILVMEVNSKTNLTCWIIFMLTL